MKTSCGETFCSCRVRDKCPDAVICQIYWEESIKFPKVETKSNTKDHDQETKE